MAAEPMSPLDQLKDPFAESADSYHWSFFETADVGVGVSLAMTLLFLVACLFAVWWIFKTGYRLKR
jgi:ABC-2 type transport system permease protein